MPAPLLGRGPLGRVITEGRAFFRSPPKLPSTGGSDRGGRGVAWTQITFNNYTQNLQLHSNQDAKKTFDELPG